MNLMRTRHFCLHPRLSLILHPCRETQRLRYVHEIHFRIIILVPCPYQEKHLMPDAENTATPIRTVLVLQCLGERVGGSVKILPVNIIYFYLYICGVHFGLTFTGFALGGQIPTLFSIVSWRPDGDISPISTRDGQRPLPRHQPHRRCQDVAHIRSLHTRWNRSFCCRRKTLKCLHLWLAADLRQNHF